MLYVDVVSLDVAVEHSFRYVHFGRLLLHGYEQRPQFLLGFRPYHVLEEERQYAQKDAEQHHRAHDAEQRDARRFHGEQFVTFAEVSEGHQRGQKDGQRQRQGNQCQRRQKEKLGKYVDFQSFSHQFVHVSPQELHHEDEKADEECA